MPLTQPFLPVHEPNDLWCIDFKSLPLARTGGWFRTADGQRCDPLTISDADSRFLIDCRIVPETIEAVRPVVDQAFCELSLPRAIRSDNGAPFASSSSPGGLTRLSVHWVKLGIGLERIEPGAPQQNGRHERMHATLKAETSRPPAATAAEQQARFDRFRHDFNDNRPHVMVASVAYRLAQAGAAVTVLEATRIGGGTSGISLDWTNARSRRDPITMPVARL
jgi:putative transposase